MENFIKKNNIKKPNFFIIGAPKCGTTSMARYLGEHPDIFFLNPKEPNYFNTDFSDKYRKVTTKKEYLNFFRETTKYKAVGEGTVWYLYSEKAIPNILEFNPETKFIIIVRNEVEMFRSLHSQLLGTLDENIKDPQKAWKLQEERKKEKFIPSMSREPETLQYGEVCKLGKQIKRAFKIIRDKDKIKIIKLQELKNNPRKVYKETLDFLNVKDDGRHKFPVYNKASKLRFPFLKKIQIILYNKLEPIFSFIRKITSTKDWDFLTKWFRKEVSKPPISKEFRQELKEYFKEDQELLNKLIEEIRSK